MSWRARAQNTREEGSSLPIPASSDVVLPVGRQDRIYKNDGNPALIAWLDAGVQRVLDVGCGAGDNAELLQAGHPGCEIFGITRSPAEAELARPKMRFCWVADIEAELPADVRATTFDAIIFSHVLEHLRDPGAVLNKFSRLVRNEGVVLIAVPNVLSWAMRWQFMRGDFEYRAEGVLDDTHLRFFTYLTADRYLLRNSPELLLAAKSVTGSVPQWALRRYVLPRTWSERIDRLGCRLWPNLFGNQVLLKAIRVASDRPRSQHAAT